MSINLRKIFLIVGLCLILCPSALAEALVNKKQVSTLSNTLTYKTVLKQAVDNSLDLKISTLYIEISKSDLKAAKADLYPVINAQANTEYNNGLGNTANTLGYVGNTVISSYTQYRNLASLGMMYNLFDFGATRKKIQIAQKTVDQKSIERDIQLKDLKLKILDLYTKIWQYNNESKAKEDILKVYKEMFGAKERLFKAGIVDNVSVMEEAVKIARTEEDIEEAKLNLEHTLNDLSLYTQQKYNPDNLEVLDFDELKIENNIVPISSFEPLRAKVIEEGIDLTFNPDKIPESKYYDFEIEKKKAELEVYKKQRLPAFKFYTNYLLYGQDPNNYMSSISSLKSSSFNVGFLGTYVFFDGFKNKANKEKASLEIKKLQLEKEKKMTELKTEYEKTYASYKTYSNELKLRKTMLKNVKEILYDYEMMYKNGLVMKNDFLAAKAELLNQECELQTKIVDISSKIKEIEIMTGRDQKT